MERKFRFGSAIRALPTNVEREIRRADTGEVVDVWRGHNRVFDSGLAVIGDLLRGVGPVLSTFALGTSAAEPDPDATGPVGEVLRSDLSLVSRSGAIVTAHFYLGTNACNGQSLQSAMVLAGDVPFSWVDFPAETKNSGYVWVFQWHYPFEAVI